MKSYLTLFALLVMSVPFTGRAEGAVEKTGMVMCRTQKTVRTIRVMDVADGCQTVYTKAGVDKVVGNAKTKASCVQVMQNIRTNLEGASWRCKDISAATISEVKN